MFPGKSESSPYKGKQLPSSAIFITVCLIAVYNRYEERDEKAEKSQPGEKDIEKSQDQIGEGDDPEVIIPLLFSFHYSVTSNVIMLAGHSFTHLPHPTHKSLLIKALTPLGMETAFLGQTFMQHPQATHSRRLTTAFLLIMTYLLFLFIQYTDVYFFVP